MTEGPLVEVGVHFDEEMLSSHALIIRDFAYILYLVT